MWYDHLESQTITYGEYMRILMSLEWSKPTEEICYVQMGTMRPMTQCETNENCVTYDPGEPCGKWTSELYTLKVTSVNTRRSTIDWSRSIYGKHDNWIDHFWQQKQKQEVFGYIKQWSGKYIWCDKTQVEIYLGTFDSKLLIGGMHIGGYRTRQLSKLREK